MLTVRANITIGWLLACFLAATATAQDGVQVLYFEELSESIPGVGNAAQSKPELAPQRWSFNAFGRAFDVALQPNAGLVQLMQHLNVAPGVAAYRGTLAGNAESWVRLVTTPRGPSGLIWDGSSLYGIEQGDDSAVAAAGTVIYRLEDVYIETGTMTCGVADVPGSGAQAFALLREEMTALEAQGASMNLNLGAVADFEFYESFGANSSAALLTRFNNIDGIFSEQVGIQITVAEIDVFSDNADPFTSSNPQDLLDELAAYRGATPEQDAQGLTHMFTGRDLDGSTAGIAFIGSLCSTRVIGDPEGRSFGAGLSEGRRGAPMDSLVAAHEMGHNFGAPHDAEAGSACESTPATFLMAPSVSGIDRFSGCSIDQMQPEIASASCLTPMGGADIGLSALEPEPTLPANVSYDYVFAVANSGADTAVDATLDVTFDSNLELLGASASSGSCNVGTGSVDCSLGDVPGGASRTVSVTLRSAVVGQHSVDAVAGAASDTNPGDNQATGSVTITPVVDLVLSGSAATLTTGERATLTVTLRNDSSFAASSLSLTATFSADLRVDAADLAGQDCAIAGSTVTCSLSALQADAQTQLLLDVTGLASGSGQSTMTVTADEDERNAADNTLMLTLTVGDAGAPPPSTEPPQGTSEDSGGGGAASWLWMLLWIPALHRRRFLDAHKKTR